MSEFKEGDVLAEFNLPQKWLVWYVDEYGYHLKSCPPYVERGVRNTKRSIYMNDAEHRFVKVGRWDWKTSKEVEEVENE